MHNHRCEGACEEQVEGREDQSSGGYEEQQIDGVSIEGDSRSRVVTTDTPSEAILVDPCGKCKG